jgi:Ca2+-binding EF-hand superfamily protein
MGFGMASPGMIRMMLTLIDTDGNGTVSLAEFQAAHERMFKAMDENKDGQLSFDEVQRFMRAGPPQNDQSRRDRAPTQPGTPSPPAGNSPSPQ